MVGRFVRAGTARRPVAAGRAAGGRAGGARRWWWWWWWCCSARRPRATAGAVVVGAGSATVGLRGRRRRQRRGGDLRQRRRGGGRGRGAGEREGAAPHDPEDDRPRGEADGEPATGGAAAGRRGGSGCRDVCVGRGGREARGVPGALRRGRPGARRPAATTWVRGTGTDVVAPFCWPRAARPAAPSATVCSGSFSRETGRPSSSASAAAIAPVRVLHPTSTTASRSPGRRRALARARCSPATAAPSVGCVSVGYGTASGRPAIVNAPPRCTRTVASTLPPPRSTTATAPPSRSPSRAAYRAAAASGSGTRETAPSPRLTATPANASCSSSPQVAGWVSTIPSGAPPSRSATRSTTRRSMAPSRAVAAKGAPSRSSGVGSATRGRTSRAARDGSVAAARTAASPTSGGPDAPQYRTEGIAALCSPSVTTPTFPSRATAAVVIVVPRSTPRW